MTEMEFRSLGKYTFKKPLLVTVTAPVNKFTGIYAVARDCSPNPNIFPAEFMSRSSTSPHSGQS